MNANLILILNESLQIDLQSNISLELLKEKLSYHISHLIQTDFQKLIFVLYKIDVSEKKLKKLLKENADGDTGKIIAELIIEKQLQKIKSRQQSSKQGENIDDDESW